MVICANHELFVIGGAWRGGGTLAGIQGDPLLWYSYVLLAPGRSVWNPLGAVHERGCK